MKITRMLFIGLGVVTALAVVSPAQAGVDWSQTFLLQGSGFENPLVRVGFNPQPEPPAKITGLDLSDPFRPILSLPSPGETPFRILFGIHNADPDVGPYTLPSPGRVAAPDGGRFEFQILSGSTLTVVFDITSSSGAPVAPGSWVGFNPQPEPPGFPDGSSIGFDFEFEAAPSLRGFDAAAPQTTLSFQIFDEDMNPMRFTVVPEPTSILLLGSGLIGLFGLSKKRKKV